MSSLWASSTVPIACRNAVVSKLWPSLRYRWFNKVGKMWEVFLSIPCDMLAESIQNPYWPLCLYFFRLQAVYLFIFIFILFSFTLTMAKEQKKRKWPPKGLAKARMVGASHHNQDINKWKEPIMKACLDEYYEERATKNNIPELVNHAAIAKKYGISPLTLHHRVSKSKSSHQVRGWRHASGGKRQPWKFIFGKCTSSFLSTVCHTKSDLPGQLSN